MTMHNIPAPVTTSPRLRAADITKADVTVNQGWGNVYAGVALAVLILFGANYAYKTGVVGKVGAVVSSLLHRN